MKTDQSYPLIAVCLLFLATYCHGRTTALRNDPSDFIVNRDAIVDGNIFVDRDIIAGTKREIRSPQFGLLKDQGDYSYNSDEDDFGNEAVGKDDVGVGDDDVDDEDDYGEDSLKQQYKRHKFVHLHHKPSPIVSGYGCRGYNCGGGGWEPSLEHNVGGGQSGSFASASAGSYGVGGSPHYGGGGGHSEANSHSASFNLGPYSASFSVAHASSNHQKF